MDTRNILLGICWAIYLFCIIAEFIINRKKDKLIDEMLVQEAGMLCMLKRCKDKEMKIIEIITHSEMTKENSLTAIEKIKEELLEK